MTNTFDKLDAMPRVALGHTPTPLDRLGNLEKDFGGVALYAKRDDCTGLAIGGNKIRQLEFYCGEAVRREADTLLITGAVQSNFVRSAAAAAAVLGMKCHIQLEERVPKNDPLYRNSGNVLLDKILGATLHSYPHGEDEAGADAQVESIAAELRAKGSNPYIIPLSPGHAPLGALGYVRAARELAGQIEDGGLEVDEIVVASGSGHTHGGTLFGIKALGLPIRVTGVCVRRDAGQQRPRIIKRCQEIADLLGVDNPVSEDDVIITDDFLAPGYGQFNDATRTAITTAARKEALILDPVYTGKTMAGFLDRAGKAADEGVRGIVFIHTGGTPAVFAYEQELAALAE
jgi:D-cysteine desulfhydrase/L-cysteate sulfo-lyase